jgi:membrane protein implicated in regulation of membrane protease activity
MPWWGWVVLGTALLGAELLVPTDFYLVFLGIAAVLVAAAAWLVVGFPPAAEWLLFAVLSAALLVLFRRRVKVPAIGIGSRVDDTLVGERGTATTLIAIDAVGRVELRGTTWSARNVDTVVIESGVAVQIEGVEGLTLRVKRAE